MCLIKSKKSTKHIICLFLIFLAPKLVSAIFLTTSQKKIKVGAYYFDGWTGETPHITESLKFAFRDRMPKGGYLTSTPKSMETQINDAAKSGISFFSFCWYYVNSDSTVFKNHPLNRAVSLFMKAPNRNKLEFNLLVANHAGSVIRPVDWETVTTAWIAYFKNPSYLKLAGKPMITIFDFKGLIKEFGKPDKVKQALAYLREKARSAGLPGVDVAICINNAKNDSQLAKQCGFDILTAYNNHSVGFNKLASNTIPIDSLRIATVELWDTFKVQNLPYIPAVTLNWDPRPWISFDPKLATSKRYEGYSAKSVFDMVKSLRKWAALNIEILTPDRIAMIYAWNEYGEGAWLTPSKNDRSLLNGLRKALAN